MSNLLPIFHAIENSRQFEEKLLVSCDSKSSCRQIFCSKSKLQVFIFIGGKIQIVSNSSGFLTKFTCSSICLPRPSEAEIIREASLHWFDGKFESCVWGWDEIGLDSFSSKDKWVFAPERISWSPRYEKKTASPRPPWELSSRSEAANEILSST